MQERKRPMAWCRGECGKVVVEVLGPKRECLGGCPKFSIANDVCRAHNTPPNTSGCFLVKCGKCGEKFPVFIFTRFNDTNK